MILMRLYIIIHLRTIISHEIFVAKSSSKYGKKIHKFRLLSKNCIEKYGKNLIPTYKQKKKNSSSSLLAHIYRLFLFVVVFCCTILGNTVIL